jgi:hypothetical protein
MFTDDYIRELDEEYSQEIKEARAEHKFDKEAMRQQAVLSIEVLLNKLGLHETFYQFKRTV